MSKKNYVMTIPFLLLMGCVSKPVAMVDEGFKTADAQTRVMLEICRDSTRIPRTVKKDGTVATVGIKDWTSGFFAGTLWHLYEYTNDEHWKQEAEKWTMGLEPLRNFTEHHDVGFMVNSSFGNGYRLTNNAMYKEVIVDAANSLATRYRPAGGIIQSWDAPLFKNSQCPVIIDNMMNLELLFLAHRLSGDQKFYNIAVEHANHTMMNHYRPDFSSYHVVDYDSVSGEVLRKCTAQGYSDESAWSRGQAWGLYGYTLCYRETHDKKYLEQAIHIADFLLNHPAFPADGVLYWDFDAPGIPNEPRDASAACVMASALIELSGFVEEGSRYLKVAERTLQTLSSSEYLADKENGHFILRNSVGSAPAKSEVSVPLNYADYYYLEALIRYKNSVNK